MKDERIKLTQDKVEFVREKNQQIEDLANDRKHWEDQKNVVDKMYQPEGNIIDLDIGGTHKITTTRATLCAF